MLHTHARAKHRVPRGLFQGAALLCAGMIVAVAQASAADAYRPGEVLVKFRDEATSTGDRQMLGARVDRVRLGRRVEKVQLNPGESVEEAIADLSVQPGVEYAQPNYIRRVQLVPNDPRFRSQWGLRNTRQGTPPGLREADVAAVDAWDVTTGDPGIIIAVIDTGIDPSHPDLDGNLWSNPDEIPGNGLDDDNNGYIDDDRGWDFVDDDNAPVDMNGHGTFIAGLLAARGDNSTAIAGVTWRASLMSLRAFDENGESTADKIVEAIDYAVDNGARLINASFGSPGGAESGAARFSQAEYDAIARARDEGVLFVASACNFASDNDGTTDVCVPASFDLRNIIAVAATDTSDELWRSGPDTGSNFGGESVDLGAPGAAVLSMGPTFGEVWPEQPINHDEPKSGIDLAGQQGCRAVVNYEDLQSFSNISLEFFAGTSAMLGDSDSLGFVPLVGGNFVGEREVYMDLSAFDGVDGLRFKVRRSPLGAPNIGTARIECYGPFDPNSLYLTSGTSMATSLVTGAAALLLAQDSTRGIEDLRSALLDSVDPVPDLAGRVSSGGRLNIARALGVERSSTQGSGGGGSAGGLGLPFLLLLAAALTVRVARRRV